MVVCDWCEGGTKKPAGSNQRRGLNLDSDIGRPVKYRYSNCGPCQAVIYSRGFRRVVSHSQHSPSAAWFQGRTQPQPYRAASMSELSSLACQRTARSGEASPSRSWPNHHDFHVRHSGGEVEVGSSKSITLTAFHLSPATLQQQRVQPSSTGLHCTS